MHRALIAAILAAFTLSLATPSRAADPVVHTIDTARELLAGELDGVALDASGRITLGPSLEAAGVVSEPVVWSVVSDRDGRIYLGTGHDGRVLATGKDGHGGLSVVLDTDEIEVTALAHDGGETLYVGTSPDGKVYRFNDGKSEVLYDPDASYIWTLAWDGAALLVGTGAPARVVRVSPKGAAEILWTSRERNITSLARVGTAVYAGTDDRGKVYRIGPDGGAFAVWDSTLREITSLVADAEGRLYVVAADLGRTGAVAAPPQPASPPATSSSGEDAAAAARSAPPPPLPPLAGPVKGPCEVARIATQGPAAGRVEILHASPEEPILRALVEPGGTLLMAAATSPGARIYRLDGTRGLSIVGKVKEGQVTAIAPLADGGVALATSNPGGLFLLGGSSSMHGSMTGPVLDAGGVARFGVVTYRSGGPSPGHVELRTRTGNTVEPGPDWTPWSDALVSGAHVPGAPSRYLQWRAQLAGPEGASPFIEQISVTSVQENLMPAVDAVSVLPPGLVFKPSSLPQDPTAPGPHDDRDLFATNLPDIPDAPGASAGLRRLEFRRGMRTATWAARDPNGDRLVFSVWLSREAPGTQEPPVPIKDELRSDWYTFDTTSLPDGIYRVQVQANDRLSNGPATAESSRGTSPAFEVDNTPPRVTATRDQDRIVVRANDAGSLFRAFASAAGGAWQPLTPEDGISDGKDEVYRLDPAVLGATGEAPALLFVKVFDRSGNVGADAVVIGGAAK